MGVEPVLARVSGPEEILACQPTTRPSRRARHHRGRDVRPRARVTNAELAARLDTSDEWIITRTGIRERRIGGPGETTSTMGAEAVRRLMAPAGSGRRHRRADRRDRHARHDVSRYGLPHPGPAGPSEDVGIRSLRGLLGISLRAHDGRADRGLGGAPAGGRRRRRPHERRSSIRSTGPPPFSSAMARARCCSSRPSPVSAPSTSITWWTAAAATT